MCRLTLSKDGVGRGQAKLVEVLSSLEMSGRDPASSLPGDFETVAMEVNPAKVSLPTTVGQCDPTQWLPPSLGRFFSEPDLLELPIDDWPSTLQRPCHMISEADEM